MVHRIGVVRGMREHGAEAHGLATRGGMMVVSEYASEGSGSNSSDEQTTHAGIENGRDTSGSKEREAESVGLVEDPASVDEGASVVDNASDSITSPTHHLAHLVPPSLHDLHHLHANREVVVQEEVGEHIGHALGMTSRSSSRWRCRGRQSRSRQTQSEPRRSSQSRSKRRASRGVVLLVEGKGRDEPERSGSVS